MYLWRRRDDAQVKFTVLSKAIKRMDEVIREADRTYRNEMQRHSGNAHMVKMYAMYIE